jgi:hypothetical protein
MRKIIFILLFCFAALNLSAQGFNWQYSPRLPFDYPFVFAGLSGGADYFIHKGQLDLKEGKGDCCSFRTGTGIGTSFGLAGEFWYTGLIAFSAKLGVTFNNGTFLADGQATPFTEQGTSQRILGRDTVLFQNKLVSNIGYLNLELGAKWRLMESHFHVGAAVEIGYLISNTFTQTESVVSPSWWVYPALNTQQRTVASWTMTNVSKISFSPRIRFGYDLTFGLGMYATPMVTFGFPLQNIADTGSWQTWYFNIGITLYRGLLYR